MGHTTLSLVPGGDGVVGASRDVGQVRGSHNKPPGSLVKFDDYAAPSSIYSQPEDGSTWTIMPVSKKAAESKKETEKESHGHEVHGHGVFKHVFDIYRENRRAVAVVLGAILVWRYFL
jgi:hypothetical protein